MIALAAACAAVAAWCVLRPDATHRVRSVLRAPARHRPRLETVSRTQVIGLAVILAVVIALAFGGLLGVLAGVATAVIVVIATQRHARRDGRAVDLAVTRQAPVIAELLSAMVGAGAATLDAIGAVAAAVPDPTSSHLRDVRSALLLGAPPEEAWSRAPAGLAPIATAIRRSHTTGAPLTYVLEMAAEDLRRDHRAAVQAAARAAGVRVVAPLALCFLPAYLLIGVVPIVASLAQGLFT